MFMQFFFVYCNVCSSGYFSWCEGLWAGWWIRQLQITGSAAWETEWSGQLVAKWIQPLWPKEFYSPCTKYSMKDDRTFTLTQEGSNLKIKVCSEWFEINDCKKDGLEMIFCKIQALTALDVKLYVIKWIGISILSFVVYILLQMT